MLIHLNLNSHLWLAAPIMNNAALHTVRCDVMAESCQEPEG